MSGPWSYILPGPIKAKEDLFTQTGLLTLNTKGQIILPDFRLRVGYKTLLVAYRQAWDAPIDTFITMHLNVDDVPYYPYDKTTVQLAPPEQDVYLPEPIELPQGCLIGVTADVGAASQQGTATTRVIVFYL